MYSNKQKRQDLMNELWVEYKRLRNKVTRILREAEANYWRQEFNNTESRKDFWQLVAKIIHQKKVNNIGSIADDQGNMIFNDKIKAEAMNDSFVAVGPNLASKINPIPHFQDVGHIYRITPTLPGVNLNKTDRLRRIMTINPNKASAPQPLHCP